MHVVFQWNIHDKLFMSYQLPLSTYNNAIPPFYSLYCKFIYILLSFWSEIRKKNFYYRIWCYGEQYFFHSSGGFNMILSFNMMEKMSLNLVWDNFVNQNNWTYYLIFALNFLFCITESCHWNFTRSNFLFSQSWIIY